MVVILALIKGVVIKLGNFDDWSGAGLIINLVAAALVIVAFWIFIAGALPRTKKEAKKFKHEGLFNPLFLLIVMVIVSILFTLGALNKTIPPIFTIIAWLISFFLTVYWLRIRKLS